MFFIHKGQEMGYVLSGKLQLKVGKGSYIRRVPAMSSIWLRICRVSGRIRARALQNFLWVKIN